MRNIDELKTELACLQSESKIIEEELLGTAQGYIDSVKNIFTSITGTRRSMYNNITGSGYATANGSWVNNVFVKALQKAINLLSPFLVTLLTPRSKKWYAPFIASFVNYGIKVASCVNYIYIVKIVINALASKFKEKR